MQVSNADTVSAFFLHAVQKIVRNVQKIPALISVYRDILTDPLRDRHGLCRFGIRMREI